MSRPSCVAPWKALSIRSNGDVGPDGQFTYSYGNIQNQTLQQLWDSPRARELREAHRAGGFHEGCSNCVKKESSIGHSRRKFFDHAFIFSPLIETFDDSGPDILYLDLNLSNRCNLKCRMCNGVSSSAWIAEEKRLAEFAPIYERPAANQLHEMQLPHLVNLLSDRQAFRNLKYVALRGGEPMMDRQSHQVLKKFVEWGLASEIVVDISTNGSVLDHELIQLLSNFKRTELYISIEGAGDFYQYIRGGNGFTIGQLEANLHEFRKIQNHIIIFAVTVSIYNILRLGELWTWFQRTSRPGEEIVMTNVVVRPEYLNFQILPQHLKELALERLQNSGIPAGDYHTGIRYMGDRGRQTIEASLARQPYSEARRNVLLNKFLAFNRDVDRLRKTSLVNHVPEYRDLAFDIPITFNESGAHANP